MNAARFATISGVRANALIVCTLLVALLGAGCAGDGEGSAVESPAETTAPPPSPPSPPSQPEPPPPPEPLIAAECADGLARTDGLLQAVIAGSERRDAALRDARGRVEAAEEVVRTSRARLADSEGAVRSAEQDVRAARAALEDFQAAHPEQELPPDLYEEWQALVAAYEQARDLYDRLYDDHAQVVAEHNGLVEARNGEIVGANRIVRALNRLERRHARLSRRYERDVVGCLAENEAAIAAQQAHVEALEERLGALGSELAGREAWASCSLTSWSKEENVLGYVQGGFAVMHLAPSVCHALYGLVALGEKPDLACLTRSREAKTPLCSPRAEQLALAIKTVAHEAQHVAGVRNEARAECFGLQGTAEAAAALGLEAEGQDLAWYAWRFSRAPESYRSKECRPGGKLDRSPQTPSWP